MVAKTHTATATHIILLYSPGGTNAQPNLTHNSWAHISLPAKQHLDWIIRIYSAHHSSISPAPRPWSVQQQATSVQCG